MNVAALLARLASRGLRHAAHCLRCRRVLLALCAPLLAAGALHAAVLQEYQVKAIFLFNFTQFVEWPPTSFAASDAPLAICVLGNDPFGNYLDDALRNETVNERRLVVRRYRSIDDVSGCQILFIGQSEIAHVEAALAHVANTGTLTVSDTHDFIAHGGMVGFVTADNHVRLHINAAAARSAGLTVSSKLLRVAESDSAGGAR